MTAQEIERIRRLEAIFDAALERQPGLEREVLLRGQCGSDPGLLEDARRLLENHEHVCAAAPRPAETLPRFGPWQSVRLLGRGGMGTVYLAERADGAFQMAVAVKVAPLALASPEVEERFRRERQFLASLDHPKVARLIDGGVTESGLPYLAMEFVDGLSIDRYCDARQLNAADRIELMRQVLGALIYVHGRGVIHRDLKPSNILVDAAGNAKLLDFGTARLVDASGDTAITKTGVVAFTPDFASPEQAQGKPLTLASDIYSAGVLLYGLLTGHPPYRLTDYSAGAVAETIGRATPAPSGLDRRLDSILWNALRKNPRERYASAAAMDADLGRYLEGRGVTARGSGRSRRIALAALAASTLAVLGASGWYRARVRAAPVTAQSLAVLPFTNANGDANNQYLADGLTTEIADDLARVKNLLVLAPSAVTAFKNGPRNLAEIGRRLHASHLVEAEVERSGDRIRIVARLERAADGSVLWSNTYQRQAADLNEVQSELETAIAQSLKVTAAPTAKHEPNAEAHEYVLKSLYEEQQMTSDAVARAEADLQRAIALDPAYGAAYYGLGSAKYDELLARGSTYQTDGERKSAERLIHKALDLQPDFPAAHARLALFAMQFDWDWPRAEREIHLSESLARNSAAEQSYAFLLVFRGRFAEAEEHIRQMEDFDPYSMAADNNLALMRALEGRFADAREIAQRMAAQSPRMLAPQQLIGITYVAEGHPELALPIFRRLKQTFPPAQMYEAMAQAKAGRKEEALRLMRPFEAKYPNAGVAMQWFAQAYALMDDGPNTVKWLERSADQHEFQALNLAVNPFYATIRDSPAFRALEKRMGLGQ